MVPKRGKKLKTLPQILVAQAGACITRGRFLHVPLGAFRKMGFMRNKACAAVPLGHSGSSAIHQRLALASATVIAVMLTIRRTVADAVKMCTGLAAPNKTGPMAIPPPAETFSKL